MGHEVTDLPCDTRAVAMLAVPLTGRTAMVTTLRTVPVTIDADKIAEGLLEMFDDNERVALRFGMLPAGKMGLLEKTLTDKFRDDFGTGTSDQCVVLVNGQFIDFSMKRLVSEATHLICLALYNIGELVV